LGRLRVPGYSYGVTADVGAFVSQRRWPPLFLIFVQPRHRRSRWDELLEGGKLAGNVEPAHDDNRFNRRPLVCDQDYAYTNAGWPAPTDPVTWPATDGATGFRGSNVLYGGGDVRWVSVTVNGWIPVGYTGAGICFRRMLRSRK